MSRIRFTYYKCGRTGFARKWAVNSLSGKVMRAYIMDVHCNWRLIK